MGVSPALGLLQMLPLQEVTTSGSHVQVQIQPPRRPASAPHHILGAGICWAQLAEASSWACRKSAPDPAPHYVGGRNAEARPT